MKIIEQLKVKSEASIDDVKIDLKLYNLADDLEKKARTHLKRVATVLTEFDIHDEKHSEKVIANIEGLLGEEVARLSSYELFLLHLSAFFHDCAMAPSDWELNTLQLTEGNDSYFPNESSIKNDLKAPLKLSAAIQLIEDRKKQLYKEYNGDVKDWIFSPGSEAELIAYLANLLVDYQNYRNGFADSIKQANSRSEFDQLNNFIRVDFIRATHHIRIETYIKNLEGLFVRAFEQPAWGKKLAQDLALICRSHGEDANFINQFSVNSQYYGSDSANLQMVAMMLRLGDIIHFSYDRAPIDLRSPKMFKSEYSFQQWAIKYSGVNYSIEKGHISFRAYCETPETYFKLHEYIDWIEVEVQNYFKYQRQWSKTYVFNLQDKVDRVNITNDSNNFLPKRGLSFSLNQKKIIELLMGVGLYKDKFACLRELYQNSLDACRCLLSQNNHSSNSVRGLIKFSLLQEDGNFYLCCTDNGIGMTKEVIENFLLKIGNSYYKSSDFFKQQAIWGGKFTPTSQFGIGILSCFMIGDKIEITTKTSTSNYISCSIDGPHENFYYRTTSLLEKEEILTSGTMIKVRLYKETTDILSNGGITKLGLLLLDSREQLPDKFSIYQNYYKEWKTNLYNKIDSIIQKVPKGIDVKVLLNDGQYDILSKPVLIEESNTALGISENDFDFIDYLNEFRRFYPPKHKFTDIKEYIENYVIEFEHLGIEYTTILTLPKKDFIFDTLDSLYSIPKVGNTGFCIDGISIDRQSLNVDSYYSNALRDLGIINFTGELRPQLSVDRVSIVEYPKECEAAAKALSKIFLQKILDTSKEHISRYSIGKDSSIFHLIWEYLFEKVRFADVLFINELALTSYGDINWKGLSEAINSQISIQAFLKLKTVTFPKFNLNDYDTLTKKVALTKLISANYINVQNSVVTIESENLVTSNLLKGRYSHSEYHILLLANSWFNEDIDYDLLSNLYPLIPQKVFNKLSKNHVESVTDTIKTIHTYSNGITAVFDQDPLLIHPTLGLYLSSKGFGEKENSVYNFATKRSEIRLFEINERFSATQEIDIYVLVAFIAPRVLSNQEERDLVRYKDKDSAYFQGAKQGWSVLITAVDNENLVIIPGKCSRTELVAKLSNDFWETYKNYTFRFLDGVIMDKP